MTDSNTPLWTLDSIRLDGRREPRLEVEHLEIGAGRTAVIGASGAGKTSLLNLLVGFETTGCGRVTNRISSDSHSLPLFWIPPDGGLWPQATVAEHLTAVLPDGEELPSVDQRLEAFGLADRAAARPGELSDGERSRLAAARGLAADAGVLVADEPLVHVDPSRLDADWRTLVQDSRDRQASLVFSTHSPEQVLRHADRVVVLERGRVVADGDVNTLYLQPPSREVANALGPANWFDAVEAPAWGVGNGETHICLRPEQIVLEPDPDGPARVIDSKAVGPIRETRLASLQSDDQRTVIHLSDPTQPIPTGRMRISTSAE